MTQNGLGLRMVGEFVLSPTGIAASLLIKLNIKDKCWALFFKPHYWQYKAYALQLPLHIP
jgi:hypothetical protein